MDTTSIQRNRWTGLLCGRAEEAKIKLPDIRLVKTPVQHFSGRGTGVQKVGKHMERFPIVQLAPSIPHACGFCNCTTSNTNKCTTMAYKCIPPWHTCSGSTP